MLSVVFDLNSLSSAGIQTEKNVGIKTIHSHGGHAVPHIMRISANISTYLLHFNGRKWQRLFQTTGHIGFRPFVQHSTHIRLVTHSSNIHTYVHIDGDN